MEQPKVIFLDAVGTLFGVKGSVGEVYSAIASEFGVKAPAQKVNSAFIESFKASAAPVFPQAVPEAIAAQEFQWWQAIAKATFEKVGIYDQFSDFAAFFSQLYAHFATAEPWYVYPDVCPALKRWQNQGIELGVLSNFDSRLYADLEALELKDFFRSVTISSTVGAAKPEPKIFQAALAKHHCDASVAWHIGDSKKEDYYGAQSVGIKAFLLKRSSPLL